mgnify:CR=1 FL=1
MHSESKDKITRPKKRPPERAVSKDSRRGVATIWVVGFGPALLGLLVLVTEISSLWLARIELETAVEAGALACVKVWGGSADTSPNRDTAAAAGVSFAQANTVLGNTFTIPPSSATFGSYAIATRTFTAGDPIIPNDGTRAVILYATVDVPGLWNGFGGPRSIQARATALYDTSSTPAPRIVSVTTVNP